MQFQAENEKNVEFEDESSKENILYKKKPKPFLFPPPPHPPQNLIEKTFEFSLTSTKIEQNHILIN